MLTKTITLNVITNDEKQYLLDEITYSTYSPRYDGSIKFIRANHVAENAMQIGNITQIEVSYNATVSEVITKLRKIIAGYDEDFKIVGKREDIPYGYQIEYHLVYPAVSDIMLDNSSRISDLGLVDGDLLIIKQQVIGPSPSFALTMCGISSFTEFQSMVWQQQDPADPMLLSTLLYTDADIDLARYVREHFDELHQMSGPRIITYVVECPPKDSALSAPIFWKAQLDKVVYSAWTLLGWVRSKPYDKATAYEIARSLGIYPDQLPCLAIFDRTDRAGKIVIPVSADFTTFFRRTFSNIQHSLYLGPGRDIDIKIMRDIERVKLFKKIRESLSLIQKNQDSQRIVYNFYGQTVFINRPIGTLRMENSHLVEIHEESEQ